MIGAFLGAAAIGAVGSYFAGEAEAEAMGKRSRAMQQAAIPSPQEVAAMNRLISSREKSLSMLESSISRNEELLNSVDPAIQQAGEQAYRLLQGEEAKALEPIRRERSRQKARIENQLAERLGSGWRSSSAGIEAMQRFEDETFGLMEQAQRESLNTFLSASIGARPDPIRDAGAFGQMAAGFDSAILSGEQAFADRRMQAASGVGAEDQAKAQNMGALFGSVGQIGANLAGQQFGSAMAGGQQSNQQNTGANNTMNDLFG